MARRVTPEQFAGALADTINGVRNTTSDAIADVMNDVPVRARTRALGFYSSVLGAPTGHLRRGIEGFARTEGNGYYAGLRVTPGQHPKQAIDRTTYGRFLEWGTRHITARLFLTTPLRETVRDTVKRMKKIIGFKRGTQ